MAFQELFHVNGHKLNIIEIALLQRVEKLTRRLDLMETALRCNLPAISGQLGYGYDTGPESIGLDPSLLEKLVQMGHSVPRVEAERDGKTFRPPLPEVEKPLVSQNGFARDVTALMQPAILSDLAGKNNCPNAAEGIDEFTTKELFSWDREKSTLIFDYHHTPFEIIRVKVTYYTPHPTIPNTAEYGVTTTLTRYLAFEDMWFSQHVNSYVDEDTLYKKAMEKLRLYFPEFEWKWALTKQEVCSEIYNYMQKKHSEVTDAETFSPAVFMAYIRKYFYNNELTIEHRNHVFTLNFYNEIFKLSENGSLLTPRSLSWSSLSQSERLAYVESFKSRIDELFTRAELFKKSANEKDVTE